MRRGGRAADGSRSRAGLAPSSATSQARAAAARARAASIFWAVLSGSEPRGVWLVMWYRSRYAATMCAALRQVTDWCWSVGGVPKALVQGAFSVRAVSRTASARVSMSASRWSRAVRICASATPWACRMRPAMRRDGFLVRPDPAGRAVVRSMRWWRTAAIPKPSTMSRNRALCVGWS